MRYRPPARQQLEYMTLKEPASPLLQKLVYRFTVRYRRPDDFYGEQEAQRQPLFMPRVVSVLTSRNWRV